MNTISYWADPARLPRFPKIDKDYHVDVAIVGGGITGITAAYLFRQAGCTVALVERGRLGGFDTVNTTAHLTSVTDTPLDELAKRFGSARAKRVWEAGQTAIDQTWNNARQEAIQCDFKWRPAFYHLPVAGPADSEADTLSRVAQIAHELGIDAEFMSAAPLVNKPAVRFARQAIFHPTRYLAGLLRGLRGKGAHIFEQSEASGVQSKPLAVKAGAHKIRCSFVFIATHTPLMGKTPLLPATLFQSKLFLYTSYALSARIPSGVAPEASFFDTGNPYYYLRIDRRRGGDCAVFGGEDHKTGQADGETRAYQRLERAFHRLFPQSHADHRWSGQVVETADGLPYIGETAPRQFVATGFAGNGMTFGTLGAMMAVDAFLKRPNPWRELFEVHRAPTRGGTLRFLKENTDYPYYLLRDRLAGAKGKSPGAVRRNEGKILELNGSKVAAYREATGKLHLLSPVCPHLGCMVGWNGAEKTWDCPCHGSRFAATGEVLSGPAEENLAPVKKRGKSKAR